MNTNGSVEGDAGDARPGAGAGLRQNRAGQLGLALLVVLALPSPGVSALEVEYEVQGTIEMHTFPRSGSRSVPVHRTNQFTIFVRDCAWLIQTINVNTNGVPVSKSEMGSVDGKEVLTLTTPLNPNRAGAPADRLSLTNGFRLPGSLGMVVSSPVPFVSMDSSVVGQLWAMYGSPCYWSRLTTNRLVPLHEITAVGSTTPPDGNQTVWELTEGPARLPLTVTYLRGDGTIKSAYRATGTTNVEGITIPNGFVFEEYSGGTNEVRKRVVSTVTSVSPQCSLKSLSPGGEGLMNVTEMRNREPGSTNLVLSFPMKAGSRLPTVEQARERIEALFHPRRRKPLLVVALVVVLLAAPPGAYYLWKRVQKRD